MSYTNTISNTKTQAHSIVPEGQDKTLLEKMTNAQGTGITGSAIRKVAQFIGMNDLSAPAKAEVTRGLLSVDFEIEQQQWRLSRKNAANLEETEMNRRLTDSSEAARKSRAFVFSKSILQSLQSSRKSSHYDRPVSRKFLNYWRNTLTAVEESERQRRLSDSLGESFKRSLARETSAAILSGLQNPSLNSTGHLLNAHNYSAILSDKLGLAGKVAAKKLKPAAESFAVSAFQIGTFAARAAYFFGGKAAIKAQDLGQKAAVQGQILGLEASIKGIQLGQQALAAGQTLGQKAAVEAQILGTKAVSGAQALGQKAQIAAHNTAAGAQNLAGQAQIAANNAIAGAQQLGDQAAYKAKELKADVSAAVADILAPTLSWKQLSAMEEAERRSRIGAQYGSNRFALALQTSGLMKDLIIAKDAHYDAESEPRHFYGSFILEETERLRRIAFDKANPIAKTNARLAADIIRAYRQQTLSQAAVIAAPAVLVKEVPVLAVSPVRYQAAM